MVDRINLYVVYCSMKKGRMYMTELGIALRKIRLDHRELLKEMAEKLNVSSAFLSAVETGKKKAPAGLVDLVCNVYGLDAASAKSLKSAEEMSATVVKINLAGATAAQHNAAVSFAKALDGLTDEDVARIMKIFEKRKRK